MSFFFKTHGAMGCTAQLQPHLKSGEVMNQIGLISSEVRFSGTDLNLSFQFCDIDEFGIIIRGRSE